MKNHLLLYVTLAFSGVTVASCVDETTEPSTAPVSAGPELAVTSNSWLIRRDMRYDRYDLSAAVVPNAAGQSILYAIGGRSGTTGLALGRVQAYNVATNTWAWGADMPIPAYMMNGAGVINGKIYVSGGFPPVGPRLPGSRLYVYDPAAGTWTRKSDMPASGFGGVTRVINGKLYVLTTCVLDNELHDFCPRSMFFRYDRIADKWAVLPRPSRAYEAGVVIAGKLYVAGSEQDKFDPVTNRVIRGASHLEVYDPATNRWTRKASPPISLGIGPAGAALNGKFYITGGRHVTALRDGWETIRTTLAYNPTTDTWTTRAPQPVRSTPWSSLVPLGRIAGVAVVLNGQTRLELVGGSLPGDNLQYVP